MWGSGVRMTTASPFNIEQVQKDERAEAAVGTTKPMVVVYLFAIGTLQTCVTPVLVCDYVGQLNRMVLNKRFVPLLLMNGEPMPILTHKLFRPTILQLRFAPCVLH